MTEEKELDETEEEPIDEEMPEDLEPSPLERAEKTVAALKEENDRLERLLKKQEKANVEKVLGGRTGTKTEKVEETPEEYARKALQGNV